MADLSDAEKLRYIADLGLLADEQENELRRIADRLEALERFPDKVREAVRLLATDDCDWDAAMKILFPLFGREYVQIQGGKTVDLRELMRCNPLGKDSQ